MPIYEYQCKACDHRLEALQKMSDAPLVDCPECGRPALHKLISAGAFILKGSGWYKASAGEPKPDAKPASKSPPACSSGSCPAAAD
jgi:putative FmdB family regulatory protein